MFYIACSVINSTLNSNALTVFKLQSTGLLLVYYPFTRPGIRVYCS